MADEQKSLAIIPRTADEARSLAKSFSASSLLPDAFRGKESDVFVQIMAGLELGLAPMASLRGLHVVKGKPILSADTMVALVRGSGLAEYFSCVEDSGSHVTYETKRRGDPMPQRCSFSMEDAKRAELLGNPTWSKYPRAMLKARCKAMLARDVFPDVLAGVYDETEREEIERGSVQTRQRPADAIEAEFTDKPKPQVAMTLLKEIEAAATYARLQELLDQCKQVPTSDPLYSTIRKAWGAKKADLSAEANAIEAQINGASAETTA